jgi:uncharacterized protein (DUF1501 family)
MFLSRRDLIKSAMATGVAMALPSWLSAGGVSSSIAWNRRLILVELEGGNDGLNTLIPYADSTYNSLRSSLKMSGANAPVNFNGGPLRMNFNLVRGPGNGRFQRLWDDGRLAIALGVGMANQSRSHFRGIDIWNTGSAPNILWTDGWLQRAFTAAGSLGGGNVAHGALLQRPTSTPLSGSGMKSLTINSAQDFLEYSINMAALPIAGPAALQHILRVRADIAAARNDIATRFSWNESDQTVVNPTFTGDTGTTMFPDGFFGEQCRAVAQLISAGTGIPIYKVTLDGFDNHSGQLNKHNDLLAQLAHGLTGLTDALHQHGKLTNTLIMTYSEFGRRVEENGSSGTDHGTLAPHFLISHESNFQGSNRIHGQQPSLTSLDERGDMLFTGTSIDYRRLYATALSFLGLPGNVFDTTYAPLTGLLTP